MKRILALVAIALAASSGVAPSGIAWAQQTGRVPVPPPTRPGGNPVVAPGPGPVGPAATPPSSSSSRPSAVPMPSQRPPSTGRPAQTSLLLEFETPQPTGRVAVAIYRDADSFRRNRSPVRTLMLTRNRNGQITAFVQGLQPGRYAIAAFQDVDGDGVLGKGAFGLPREPFGFSNNARARFGPPSFDSAAFSVGATGSTQRIVLRNPMNAILR